MTEPVYHSALWKSALLVGMSTHFPDLVRAAAMYLGKPYSTEMVQQVATNLALLGGLQVKVSETIDYALMQYATNPETAGALDGLILDAVAAYEAPADPQGS
jgi:hypothetical protein